MFRAYYQVSSFGMYIGHLAMEPSLKVVALSFVVLSVLMNLLDPPLEPYVCSA